MRSKRNLIINDAINTKNLAEKIDIMQEVYLMNGICWSMSWCEEGNPFHRERSVFAIVVKGDESLFEPLVIAGLSGSH